MKLWLVLYNRFTLREIDRVFYNAGIIYESVTMSIADDIDDLTPDKRLEFVLWLLQVRTQHALDPFDLLRRQAIQHFDNLTAGQLSKETGQLIELDWRYFEGFG